MTKRKKLSKAWKRFPVRTEWIVELTYRLVPDFSSLDRGTIFPAAAAVVGGKGYSHGSGAGFGDRDHDWRVRDRSTALRLVRALRKAATTLPNPRITLTAPPKVILDVPVPKSQELKRMPPTIHKRWTPKPAAAKKGKKVVGSN